MKINFSSLSKSNILLNIAIGVVSLSYVLSEPPKANHHPLVYKTWPPNRSAVRSNGLMLQLRGAAASNLALRQPGQGMFFKSSSPIRFAIPTRSSPGASGSLQPSPSNQFFFKVGPPHNAAALKRPYASHYTAPQGVFKFSTPHKAAIKFQPAPSVPLKSKPEYIYEKVHVPKYPEAVQKYNIGSDGAIHTIQAPNLSLNNPHPVPELNNNNLNSQFDSDLINFSPHAFAIEKPVTNHQYQVRENINDITFKNTQTGQQTYYAPDNDPSLKTTGLRPVDDPLSVPSDGKPKPSDVLFHQNIEYHSSPLIQHQQYSVDPYGYSTSLQPQLQQYHLQQNTMLKHGMPLASLNPTYLVMQSNNLLGQHQQHLTANLFRPEHGYIDTSVTAQPSQATYASYDYSSPQQVASLGQIYSSQRDELHQQAISSTQAPSTVASFSHEVSHANNNPSYTQQLEPQPSHYQYSQQNFIDLPDEHLSQNDIQNLLSYNDMYQDYVNHRQIENDLILREAQEKLQQKLHHQHQQQQTAFNLHQLVQQEKYHPMRIVVPDEDQQVS